MIRIRVGTPTIRIGFNFHPGIFRVCNDIYPSTLKADAILFAEQVTHNSCVFGQELEDIVCRIHLAAFTKLCKMLPR